MPETLPMCCVKKDFGHCLPQILFGCQNWRLGTCVQFSSQAGVIAGGRLRKLREGAQLVQVR